MQKSYGLDRKCQTECVWCSTPRNAPDHPLRAIRAMADQALANMSERFDGMYAKTGRPSIPPEKLLRAQLIQMLYSVRSERLLAIQKVEVAQE